MDHSRQPGTDDTIEGTEDRRLQDRQFFAEREAITRSQESEALARARVEALEAVLHEAQDYPAVENQTLDPRGHQHHQEMQSSHARGADAADGVFIGTVLVTHLAQQAGEFWQQRQEARIDQILAAQIDDPALDAENSFREEILAADLARNLGDDHSLNGTVDHAGLDHTESAHVSYTGQGIDDNHLDAQGAADHPADTDYSAHADLAVSNEQDNGYD